MSIPIINKVPIFVKLLEGFQQSNFLIIFKINTIKTLNRVVEEKSIRMIHIETYR